MQTVPLEPNIIEPIKRSEVAPPAMTVSAVNQASSTPSQARRQLTALWAQAYELTRRFEALRIEHARLRETHVELRGPKAAAR